MSSYDPGAGAGENHFEISQEEYIGLYRGNLIPLHACLVGLTWILYDYFDTFTDEVKYIWPQPFCTGKVLYLWIRYYSIFLVAFDVAQIHIFALPGVPNDTLCLYMDSIIRIVGAVSLFSVEIVVQLRIFALYKCSRTIAWINAILFAISIGVFCYILVHNAMGRAAVIADVVRLPLPGCPTVHSGIEWLQWVPALLYELILFLFAMYRTFSSISERMKSDRKLSLMGLVLRDNMLYFFGITLLLVLNNLMVSGYSRIPWFSYSPFHAAIGILTARMLLNVRKATIIDVPDEFEDPMSVLEWRPQDVSLPPMIVEDSWQISVVESAAPERGLHYHDDMVEKAVDVPIQMHRQPENDLELPWWSDTNAYPSVPEEVEYDSRRESRW